MTLIISGHNDVLLLLEEGIKETYGFPGQGVEAGVSYEPTVG